MDFYVGQCAKIVKTIHEKDVVTFANICGDLNPIHLDEKAAANSIFKKRIVHGAMINAFISTVIGMYLPGPGTIYLSQESHFRKPVYIGDTIHIEVEILDINEKRRAHLKTTVKNEDNQIVLEGTAYTILP